MEKVNDNQVLCEPKRKGTDRMSAGEITDKYFSTAFWEIFVKHIILQNVHLRFK